MWRPALVPVRPPRKPPSLTWLHNADLPVGPRDQGCVLYRSWPLASANAHRHCHVLCSQLAPRPVPCHEAPLLPHSSLWSAEDPTLEESHRPEWEARWTEPCGRAGANAGGDSTGHLCPGPSCRKRTGQMLVCAWCALTDIRKSPSAGRQEVLGPPGGSYIDEGPPLSM